MSKIYSETLEKKPKNVEKSLLKFFGVSEQNSDFGRSVRYFAHCADPAFLPGNYMRVYKTYLLKRLFFNLGSSAKANRELALIEDRPTAPGGGRHRKCIIYLQIVPDLSWPPFS